jgi:hypothetical protein
VTLFRLVLSKTVPYSTSAIVSPGGDEAETFADASIKKGSPELMQHFGSDVIQTTGAIDEESACSELTGVGEIQVSIIIRMIRNTDEREEGILLIDPKIS